MTSITQNTARPEVARSIPFARASGDPIPTTNADELCRQSPEIARAFFQMAALEPISAVGVVSMEGTILYVNEHGARLMRGEETSSARLVGRSMSEFFPPEIMRERLEIFKRTGADAPPVLIRNIWNGNQLAAFFQRVSAPDDAPGRDVMIVRGRLIPGDLRSLYSPDMVTLVYSSFVRLGPLDCLSPQELRVMALIGAGMSVREAAKELHRAEKTIESHCTAIHRKLGVNDRLEVARLAQRAGLTLEDAERVRV
ncbi:MAG: PAS and helix-turn-helix domain-containing protein [Phycisphaerales bacterium]